MLGNHGNPDLTAEAYIGLGNFYSGQRDNQPPLDYYQRALNISPRNKKAKGGKERCEKFLGEKEKEKFNKQSRTTR
jgi:hypothetical protein